MADFNISSSTIGSNITIGNNTTGNNVNNSNNTTGSNIGNITNNNNDSGTECVGINMLRSSYGRGSHTKAYNRKCFHCDNRNNVIFCCETCVKASCYYESVRLCADCIGLPNSMKSQFQYVSTFTIPADSTHGMSKCKAFFTDNQIHTKNEIKCFSHYQAIVDALPHQKQQQQQSQKQKVNYYYVDEDDLEQPKKRSASSSVPLDASSSTPLNASLSVVLSNTRAPA